MNLSKQQLWERFCRYYREFPTLSLKLDVSRMAFDEDYIADITPRVQRALSAMSELERGGLANPDEKRMVGHYWLRKPELSPNPEIRSAIQDVVTEIQTFADAVHAGRIAGAEGTFQNLLLIGIGGSALGPQFVSHALGHPASDRMRLFTFDNTDPDGMDRVLDSIGRNALGQTLCVVISKSGGTKETRNGMLEAINAYKQAGVTFASHAVAITQLESELDRKASSEQWLKRFPMWDWVGGRTSELSAVGLLPAALQGFHIRDLLRGAAACDEITRSAHFLENPAALLAAMWHYAGNAHGEKVMVVLPYKDRLELFSKYLQQLVMESLGKEMDLGGQVVNQGLYVFGNKGSTDQHAYIQQLRDGLDNFFVLFIEALQDREGVSIEVEPGVRTGDYLTGFLLGTREALYQKGRQSITITVDSVSAFSVGVLIALFERAVGLYATLVNVNAYHQPGVEAGKKAASNIIALQVKVVEEMESRTGQALTAKQMAEAISAPEETESVFRICEHLSANPNTGIRKDQGGTLETATYSRS